MTDPLPAPPSAVDVVPTEEFDELIARTQKDLARLEREHTIAEAAAIAAERSVSDVPDDPELTDWAEAQLDRFVAGLRAEHDAEMEAVLAAARDRAAACIERAEHEADLVLSYARATVDARATAPWDATARGADPAMPVVWRADVGAVATPAHATSPPPAPPVLAAAPVATEPTVPPAPTIAPEALVPAVVAPLTTDVTDSPWALSTAPTPSPWTELAADQDVARAEAAAVEEPAREVVPALVSTTGSNGGGASTEPDREFWKEPEHEAPKRGLFKRLPMFAILQVVGVVIVLVVVLLRIG